MAGVEMNEYPTIEDQKNGNYQSLPAPPTVEAQPVGKINYQTGQPQQSEHHYKQLSPGSQQQFVPQQGYAPPPGKVSHTQTPPGYAPQTQHPPGYALQTQPPPGYVPHPQPQPGYVQQGYSAQPLANGYVTGQKVIVQAPQRLPAVTDTGSTCWMVVGILTAIFLCLPLGAAGAVMAYLSGEDARRGNAAAYKTKICQSKALTLTGLGIGLLIIIVIITVILVPVFSIGTYAYSSNSVTGYWDSATGYAQKQASDATYIGCFEDSIFRDLDGYNYNFGNDLSVEKCTIYCSERGYKYAGLQGGYLCSCGASYGSYRELDQDECSSVCSTDGMECGGAYTHSIYKTNYVGCYKDDLDKGTLDYYADLPSYEIFPNNCVKQCKIDGYRYAATWNGKYCYCGNDLDKFTEAPANECSSPCLANIELICGGVLRSSVYTT